MTQPMTWIVVHIRNVLSRYGKENRIVREIRRNFKINVRKEFRGIYKPYSVKKTFQLNFNQLASGGVKKEFQFVGEIPNRIIYNREKEQKS